MIEYSENFFIPTKNGTAAEFVAEPSRLLSYSVLNDSLAFPEERRTKNGIFSHRRFTPKPFYCAFSFFAAFFFFLSSSKRSGIKASKTMMTAAAMAR